MKALKLVSRVGLTGQPQPGAPDNLAPQQLTAFYVRLIPDSLPHDQLSFSGAIVLCKPYRNVYIFLC